MTGQEEIESTVRCIRDISKDTVGAPPLVVCPLYAALPSHLQLKVFHKTPQVRKFIYCKIMDFSKNTSFDAEIL